MTTTITLECEIQKVLNSLEKMKPYRIVFSDLVSWNSTYLYLRSSDGDRDIVDKVTADDTFFVLGDPSLKNKSGIIDLPVITVNTGKIGFLAIEPIVGNTNNYHFTFQEVLPTDINN